MKRQLLLATAMAAMAATTAGVAHGKECIGVSFPDRLESGGRTLVLNGLGLRQATMFKVNVYVGALYLVAPSTDAQAVLASTGPKALALQFVRNVAADDLVKAWSEGFEKNAKAEMPALQERIATLGGWMTDVKAGQRLDFSYSPGTGVQVDMNGATKGVIKGDDFARAFFSIWLGDPPNAEIKRGLLGGACA